MYRLVELLEWFENGPTVVEWVVIALAVIGAFALVRSLLQSVWRLLKAIGGLMKKAAQNSEKEAAKGSERYTGVWTLANKVVRDGVTGYNFQEESGAMAFAAWHCIVGQQPGDEELGSKFKGTYDGNGKILSVVRVSEVDDVIPAAA